ncbi:Uncharacterised protein [Brucella anthropi]|nr:Uncharacterised protein [Brucella anthropi]
MTFSYSFSLTLLSALFFAVAATCFALTAFKRAREERWGQASYYMTCAVACLVVLTI